jgi:hypothetical protein
MWPVSYETQKVCVFVLEIRQSNGLCPVDASLSSHTTMIISSINILHNHINLKLHTLLSKESCDRLGIPDVISSEGVLDSDTLFDNIRFMWVFCSRANGSGDCGLTCCRHFTLPPRSLLHWNRCIHDATSSSDFQLGSLFPPQDDPISPPPPCQLDESGQTIHITCKLDPSQFQNGFLRDKVERAEWTERQRQKALSAASNSRLESYEDLANYVRFNDLLVPFPC